MANTAPLLCAVLVALCGTSVAGVASRPASAPAEWGEAKAGLQTRVSVEGEIAPGGKFLVRLELRNAGSAPVKVGGAWGWMLLAQSREKAFYTEKIALAGKKGWPEQLEPDKSVGIVLDLAPRKAFAMQKGLKVIDGYPAAGEGGPAVAPAGEVGQLLPASGLRGRFTLCVGAGEGAVVLSSNALAVAVAAPDFKALSPQARKAYIADLLGQFRQDEFASQQAHHRAVKIGRDILPDLLEAASDADAPYFAKMWLTTAIIDIGDPRAADTLVKLLQAGDASVRNVIAYHGPKLRSEKLNAAILARAQQGSDPAFAAWAARGMAAGGQAVPEELIDAAVKSREPRARAEIAEVLAKKGDDKSIGRLVTLLGDEQEGVRAAAAKAIGAANLRKPQLVGDLVKSLDLEGDTARAAVCACLVKLTGQSWTYDLEAGPAGKATTVANWKQWWAKAGKDYK